VLKSLLKLIAVISDLKVTSGLLLKMEYNSILIMHLQTCIQN